MIEFCALDNILAILKNPNRLYSCFEILKNPSFVPKKQGVYGWYFKNIPEKIPICNCIKVDGLKLLYIGIAGLSRDRNLRTLYDRIVDCHLGVKGRAEESTLRFSMGVLLTQQLNIQLQLKGESKTFGDIGEKKLTEWFADNASVTWIACRNPEGIEKDIIQQISLPLNLMYNTRHCFCKPLKKMRKATKNNAQRGGN